MSWKEWVVTGVLLLAAFAILYAVSVWGGNKVDNAAVLQFLTV